MRTTLLLLCCMLLAACSDDEKVPEDILPKKKMVPLIIDVYVAESKVSNMGLSRDSSVAIFEVYEDTLFQKHGVEESVYRKSVSYYYDNPTKMEAIYETVLDSLNLREQRLKKARSDKEEEGNAKKKKEGKK
ncbi:MAG: DUF4296 domain-containing protein [Fulvivirga sp.]